jgi:hypothetical protein
MYVIPLILIVLLAAIAVAWSPIFALIFAVPAFIAFLAFVGMRPRTDEKMTPPTGSAGKYEEEGAHKGIWGEPRA